MESNDNIRNIVLSDFHQMKNQKDLVSLLNKILFEIIKGQGIDAKDYHSPITEKTINFYKNIKASGNKRYRSFTIKKKSGKLRVINAPAKTLKTIQMCLNEVFQVFYEPTDNAFGFVPQRNIADGAKHHVNRRFVYNIDLKDFFDTIELYRVKAILANPPIKMKDQKGNGQSLPYIISNLCCHPKEVTRFDKDGNSKTCIRPVLPQGAPTSPILTNMVCRNLDRSLNWLAKKYQAIYTRYADDITFSSDKNIFKDESSFIKEMRKIIEVEQGFKINDEKTRLQSNKYRQEVTGLIVNEKVNVTKRFVKQIRMWLYLWETYGYDKAYACFLHDYIADKGHVKPKTAKMENVISGKLEYLKMVVGKDNPMFQKLNQRFEKLISQDDTTEATPAFVLDEVRINDGQVDPHSNEVITEEMSLVDLLKTLIDKI